MPDPHFARTRRAFLLLCLCLWLLIYPLDAKLRCLLLSLAYSFVEYNFTFFERGKAYTSLAQFLANVVYMPVLVDLYGHFLQNPIFYVLLFPANIWLLEIVQGTAIHWIYGRNVAWCYADYADELFGGLIRLGHAIWWWGLGAALWLFYPGAGLGRGSFVDSNALQHALNLMVDHYLPHQRGHFVYPHLETHRFFCWN